jgi:hypothetical protein
MPAWEGKPLLIEGSAYVDEVIADHPEPDPSLHSRGSFVAATVQAVPPLEYADSAFAARSPLLPFAEPALFLVPSSFSALGRVIRD